MSVLEIVLLALAGDFLLVIAVGKFLACGGTPTPSTLRVHTVSVPTLSETSLSAQFEADFEAWEKHFSSV